MFYFGLVALEHYDEKDYLFGQFFFYYPFPLKSRQKASLSKKT